MLGKNILSMSALSLYRNAVQFGMSIVVMAFVGPEEYGLVVFTLPFVTIIAMLTDLGLSSAILRAPVLDRRDGGAALTLMLTIGLGLAGTMAAIAGPLSRLIAMPGLSPIMLGMAFVVLLNVASTTPRAMIERRLRYGMIAQVEGLATLVGAFCGLVAAWRGAGAWALVLYNFVFHAIRVTSFLWLSRRDVEPNIEWRRLRPLVGFGSWVLSSNLLNFLARNSDNLLIGGGLGAAAVGIYGLSYQFMLAPMMAITWPATGILLSTLRNEALDQGRGLKMIEGVIAATAMITFPAMTFLSFGLAFPMEALASPRWHGVPEVVAWLAPLGALQSVASYSGAIFLITARARLQLLLTILNTVALVATFLATIPFGLMAVVRGYVVVSFALNLGFLATIVRFTPIWWRGLLSILAPAILATASGLLVVAATVTLHPSSWAGWFAATGLFGTTVLAVYTVLAGQVQQRLRVLMSHPV